MKRKRPAKSEPAAPEPIIAPEIKEAARRSVAPMRAAKPGSAKCIVCGSECVLGAAEQLCWVCRRLKISAWRDSEQQPAVQE